MEEHLKQVYVKLASFCAYQERTHEEVRKKLDSLFIEDDDVEEIIAQLIQDNFLNETRFAQSYAGGKFRIKSWGKKRILFELKRKEVSEYNIRLALQQIEDKEYKVTLMKLAKKKLELLSKKESNKLLQKKKLIAYLVQKGYEPDLVWSTIEPLFN